MSRPEIDNLVVAFCQGLDQSGNEYKVERGPKGKWLFRCEETIYLDHALEAAVRAAMAREAQRTAVSVALSEWKEMIRERP